MIEKLGSELMGDLIDVLSFKTMVKEVVVMEFQEVVSVALVAVRVVGVSWKLVVVESGREKGLEGKVKM